MASHLSLDLHVHVSRSPLILCYPQYCYCCFFPAAEFLNCEANTERHGTLRNCQLIRTQGRPLSWIHKSKKIVGSMRITQTMHRVPRALGALKPRAARRRRSCGRSLRWQASNSRDELPMMSVAGQDVSIVKSMLSARDLHGHEQKVKTCFN
jgi:hypothetical protein